MIDSPRSPDSVIDVTLDLRQLSIQVDERRPLLRALSDAWRQLSRDLVGKSIADGEELRLTGQLGPWAVRVVDSHGLSSIADNTLLNVIDIQRNPEVRHACKQCRSEGKVVFGPFFCAECRKQNLPDRLCENHTHFLENRYTAYCKDHVPRCQCRAGCTDTATFECDYCHSTFSDRWKHTSPTDPTVLLCTRCYSYRYERCEECQRLGEKALYGRLRCAFPSSGTGDTRHGRRLCIKKHAFQWQIWGPHWEGVTLCEEHYRHLGEAQPADLIWMIVTASAPAPFLRGKASDAPRVRNIVSYVRRQELSWTEMERVLATLQRKATDLQVPRYVTENLERLLRSANEAGQTFPVLEQQLLGVVRDFYRPYLRWDPALLILGVTVKRAFGPRGQAQTYRIAVHVARDSRGQSYTGLLVGKGGSLVNQLRDHLKSYRVDGIDFVE